MTWLYAPSACSTGTEDSSSPADSQEPTYEPWLVLSGTATRRPSSWPGWKRRPWIAHLSGTMSRPSTARRGVAAWISSLPASTANRSRPQDSVEVSMTSDGSGPTSPGSSLTWDRDTCSWRTSPDLFGSVFHTSSPTLPTSGSMRNGVVSQRPPLEPVTDVNGSGYWPTTTTMDAYGLGGNPNTTGSHGTTLTDRAVRMWGTPVARDDQKSPEAHMAMKEAMGRNTVTSLTVQVKMWPTPLARDGKGEPGTNFNQSNLVRSVGLHHPTTTTPGTDGSPKADLNPRFVAALMGVPWDWLNPCTPVETDSYHAWLRKHSPNWRLELASDER